MLVRLYAADLGIAHYAKMAEAFLAEVEAEVKEMQEFQRVP
jgi:molybdopterin synthase catalytic subunit